MANNSRIVRGNIQRMLQYGLDEIIDQNGREYRGEGSKIFKEVSTDKAWYEVMQLAGVGMAGRKDEGAHIQLDSIDQHWVFRQPVYTYQKGVRITEEAQEDNVYENMMPRISKEIYKSLMIARDQQMANILNYSFTDGPTYGDGKVAIATDHPVQAGGTNSNRLAVDEDLSEAAIENLKLLCDGMVNDDGQLSDYSLDKLIVPSALQFEARRILKSDLRYATSDNDANILRMEGVIKSIIDWKRLSDSDAYFCTTDAEYGLCFIRRRGVYTTESVDPYNGDKIVSGKERYQPSLIDHRGLVGCPGA